jgi:hypothetical protein
VPAAPQVVDLGGTVLSAAKIQLIAYTQDPMVTDVEAFITEFGSTTEWATQTSEYGVGPFTQLPTILIPGTPPTQLDDNSGAVTPFEQTLINNTTGANPPWAVEDGTVLYVFLLPLGTNISSGGSCCSDFLGYHYEAPLPTSGNEPYAVVCDCGVVSGYPLTATQWVTTTVNHEMVEGATDPFFLANPAYAQSDENHAIWTVATGGEIADMCDDNSDSNYLVPGATYMIQRTWSDNAADAGLNPCVPVPATGPYFNSYPVLPDTITLQYDGPWTTQGVSLAIGQSTTIDVVLASEAPTSGPWTVTAYDYNDYVYGAGSGSSPTTTVSLDKTSGSNGDVLHLTITALSYDSSFGGGGFVLDSSLNGQDNLSFGAIGQ